MLPVARNHETMVFMLNFTTIPKVLFSPGRGHFTLPASRCTVHASHFLQTCLFKCIWAFSISHTVTFTGGIHTVTLIAMWAAVAQFSKLPTQREAMLQKDSV